MGFVMASGVTKQAGANGANTPSWKAAPLGRVAAPLRDQVLGVVRQAILDFELQPGQRLIERELIEQLNVSRATVREVLALLVSEGLVTVIPQKGAVVTVLSASEAADIYEMRASLEALAARRFVERALPADLEQLSLALLEVERTAGNGADKLEHLRAKDMFYDALLAGAKSPPLAQTLTTLQGRVRAMRANSLAVAGRAKQAAKELRRIYELIEQRDADGAAEACIQHVRNAARIGMGRLTTHRGGRGRR